MDIKLKYKFLSGWDDALIMEKDEPEVAARKLLHGYTFRCLVHRYENHYDIWYSEDEYQNSQEYRVEMSRIPILEINGAHYILTQDFHDESIIN